MVLLGEQRSERDGRAASCAALEAEQRTPTVWLLGACLALFAVTGALVVLYAFLQRAEDSPLVQAALRIFDLNGEANAPAWYAAMLWLLASLSTWWLARHKRALGEPYSGHWTGLSLTFLVMSLDEIAMIHETIGAFFDDRLATLGFFFYSWTIFGLIFVGLFASVYAKFLRSLPSAVRLLLLASGGVFISGALDIEMITAAAESGTPVYVLYDNEFRAEDLNLRSMDIVNRGPLAPAP